MPTSDSARERPEGFERELATVQRRPSALVGSEHLAIDRIVDGANDASSRHRNPDRDRELLDAVEVVDRAVEGVDHPSDAGGSLPGAAFFTEDAVVGPSTQQGADDQLLAASVDFGHEIGRARLGGSAGGKQDPAGDPFQARAEELARGLGNFLGELAEIRWVEPAGTRCRHDVRAGRRDPVGEAERARES